MIFTLGGSLMSQGENDGVRAQSISLSSLIILLEEEYNVQFSYPSHLLTDQVFDIETQTHDLSVVLEELVSIYPLEYQLLDDRTVLLRKRLSIVDEPEETSRPVSLVIKDIDTHLPLVSAAVGILGTTIGDYTNEKGEVSFRSPKSSIVVQVHLLGYQSETLEIGNIYDNEIYLKPQVFSIEEVMIQDRSDFLKNNDQHSVVLQSRHISTFNSGIVGDNVVRQVQLLPGVFASNDASSKLLIRGGDEDGTLIIVDHIPVYDASHYYGLFSAINPAYISHTTLYKNNLPISYGGKTDGMLQVTGMNSDTSGITQGQIDINLLIGGGAIRHCIGERWCFSLGARTSLRNVSDTNFFNLFDDDRETQVSEQNFNLTNRTTLLATTPDFLFFDVNSSMSYRWSKGSLQFNHFRSQDNLDDGYENQFDTRRQNVNVTNTERYNNSEDWSNEGLSVLLHSGLKDHVDLKSQVYHTLHKNFSAISLDINRDAPLVDRSFSISNLRDNTVEDIGFKTSIISTLDPFIWSLGVDVIHHQTMSHITNDNDDVISRNQLGVESSIFGSLKIDPIDQLSVDFGLRGTLFGGNLYGAPRLDLTYRLSDQLNIKSSVGRHNQFVRQLSFENVFGRTLNFWELANGNIQVGHTDQIMLGIDMQEGRVNIDIEGYYKKRYNLIEQALLTSQFDEINIVPQQINQDNYRLFRGDGQTVGLDILLSYTLPRYSGWISYTWSKSTVNFDQILRDIDFPTQDDRRHQLKVVNEYRMGRLTLGSTMVFASGRPYTDLNKVAGQDRDQLRPRDRISRLPDYFRTDLGMSYQWDIYKNKLDIGLSIYNVLDRANVNYIQYIFSIPTNTAQNPNRNINSLLGTESNLLGRTVNLNVKYSF